MPAIPFRPDRTLLKLSRGGRVVPSAALSAVILIGVARAEPLDAGAPSPEQKTEEVPVDTDVQALLRHAIDEFHKGDFEAAHAAFAQAWKVRPRIEIAASLAETEMKLGRFEEAAQHWEYYLEHLPPDRNEARKRLAECQTRAATARLWVEPPDGSMVLDGQILGPVPQDSDLSVGFDRRGASPPEHVPSALENKPRTQPARADDLARHSVPPPSPSRARPAPTAKAPSTKPTPRTLTLIGGTALSAAAFGAGFMFRLEASAAEADAHALHSQVVAADPTSSHAVCLLPAESRPTACDQTRDRLDDSRRFTKLANASFIVGGVLGISTLVTYFLWPDATERPKIGFEPLLVPGGRGARVTLAF